MDLPSLLLLAVGLALDCLAVSICSGLGSPRVRPSQALRMAGFFAGFQVLMPLLGWFGGLELRSVIGAFDHWVAFGLLAGVGTKMIVESRRPASCAARPDPFGTGTVLLLAVATSIDALAVGLGLSLLAVAIVLPVTVIGAVTFAMSLGGIYAGRRFGELLERKAELVGGVILIGIGARILVEHLAA